MIVKEEITDLFFDLDHTIYDFDKNSKLAFQGIFSSLNIKGIDDFMVKFKPINDDYWERYAKEEITHNFLRYGRLKDTFDAMNMEVPDNHIYHIADCFIENLTNYHHVFEGAYEVLNYLQEHYRLHIITNGPEKVQELKLRKTKLDHYFETVTNSEKAGVKKPHPDIFHHALKTANVTASKSVMIGDNFKADVEGALSVGMKVVWFNEFKKISPLDIPEIYKLQELKNIF